jgi:hypothetical protein
VVKAIRRWPRPLVVEFLIVLAVTFALLAASSHFRSTPYNQPVRQAFAWLHGRFWIDWPGPYMEALEYNGEHYAQYPPMPALLSLPLVLIWGMNANQTAIALAACLIAIAATWLTLVRLGVARVPRLLLTLFFFAGTDLWWCSQLGDVWFIAHSVAVMFTMLALLELTGARRGWLVALYAFCAFESRAVMLLALPLYAYLLWRDDLVEQVPGWAERAGSTVRKRLIGFGAVWAAGAAVYAAYNFAKWGVPYDAGYTLYFHQEPWGQPTGSPFRLSFVPYEIFSFFMQPPVLVEWRQQALWPLFKVDPHGVALTFTSPALVLAFFAQIPRRLKFALWGTIALIFLPNVTYYLNGWYQFGMRHALDFEPYLLLLMAFAARAAMPVWATILIVYSSLTGLWGVWWWNQFMRMHD